MGSLAINRGALKELESPGPASSIRFSNLDVRWADEDLFFSHGLPVRDLAVRHTQLCVETTLNPSDSTFRRSTYEDENSRAAHRIT